MKKAILLSTLLWSVCIVSSYCQTNFSGTWYIDEDSSDFSLVIQQIGNTITGNHCGTADNGNFIDCNVDNPTKSVTGIAEGDSALVTFRSSYCNKQGTAIIKKLNPTQIQWKIIKNPDGLFYVPLNVRLNLSSQAGSFTMQSSVLNITSNIANYGIYASFHIAFVPKTDAMLVGTSYLVANISENCRPSVQQDIMYTVGDNVWNILINPDGNIYFKIMTSPKASVSGGISFGTITYRL